MLKNMEIIPAIDIFEGKCVRLSGGDFKSKKVYSGNPLKIARLFQEAGFSKIHLIDLEGAKVGKIKNWPVIRKIAQNTNLSIEFGGGIREERDIKKLFNLGIDRVILGSLVLEEPERFKKIFKKFGERIIIAVDIKGKEIYYQGWQKNIRKKLQVFLKELVKLGIKTITCTDVERDGALKGPNLALYKKLVKKLSNLKIIASGGVRNTQDLKKLSKIGVTGVIIGKAIYENKISLNDLKSFI
jgi:phosphoribosylformimino-5-aminoimidazole carboxamide ribotide isomerase